MICPVCKSDAAKKVATYFSPDRYEEFMGISNVRREWFQCKCGLYASKRNYDLARLQKIYGNGYRSTAFRGELIERAFLRVINARPKSGREIEQRLQWVRQIVFKSVLDIGSGLGVWPWVLAENGHDVWCTELNKHSKRFIRNVLNINCTSSPPRDRMFDLVSVVHVLEHMEDPVRFLKELKPSMAENGTMFIEVPDAEEFEYLPLDNNEFSSDHVLFFDRNSLLNTVHRTGMKVVKIDQAYYKDRDLKRLMLLCR